MIDPIPNVILTRVNDIKAQQNGFDKATMRWRRCTFMDKPICDVVFEKLSIDELLDVYEKIIRQLYKRM